MIAALDRARRRLRAARPLAATVAVVAAIAFFGQQRVRGQLAAPPWPAHDAASALRMAWGVALGVALLAAVLAWGVFTWHRVLRALAGDDRAPSFRELLLVWARTSPARWLPGGVWQVVAVGALAGPTRAARVRLLVAFAIHTGLTLVAAALLAAITRPRAAPGWVPLAALASVVAMHPALVRRAVRVCARVTNTAPLTWRAGWWGGLGLLALHAASWAGYEVAFAVFVRAVAHVPPASVAELAGAATLAFLVGYAAVIVPAGIGVREVTLSLLLAPALGPAALAVAVLARVWSVAAECLLALAVAIGAVVVAARAPAAGDRAGTGA